MLCQILYSSFLDGILSERLREWWGKGGRMNIESGLDCRTVLHFVISFMAGLGALCILSLLVTYIVSCLQRKGGLEDLVEKERSAGLRLAEWFGRVEHSLFFLAAIVEPEFFKWAVAAYLVFKAIHRWELWRPEKVENIPEEVEGIPESAQRAGMSEAHYRAAIGRNRFLVFVAGTGLSIAAGGLAGAVFHFVMRILN